MFHFISQWYLKDRLFSGTDCCCRSLYFILSSNDRSIKVCENVVQISFIYWWNYKMNKKFTFFHFKKSKFTNTFHQSSTFYKLHCQPPHHCFCRCPLAIPSILFDWLFLTHCFHCLSAMQLQPFQQHLLPLKQLLQGSRLFWQI